MPNNKKGYYSELITATRGRTSKPKGFLSAPKRTQLAWQVATEHHSAIVKDLNVETTRQRLGDAKRWMSFPGDPSVIFPAETFSPKLQSQKIVQPRELPRNVELERRRRSYRNIDMTDLLGAEGIDTADLIPPIELWPHLPDEEKYGLFGKGHFLPLDIFDDEEFDCRTSTDWIELGIIDGTRFPLPAIVFVERVDRNDRRLHRTDEPLNLLFDWYHAAVTDYDTQENLWHVLTLDGQKREYKLSRLYVRFFAEDPHVFVRRLASAIKARNDAESSIKYHFYVDCMRLDGIPELTEEEKAVILNLSMNNECTSYNDNHVEAILEEIAVDYQRTMCDLIWRRQIDRNPEMFRFITWTPKDEEIVAPEVGKIDTAMKIFEEMKTKCHWTTLYVLPEVYHAMACIVDECQNTSNMNLFTANYGKSVSLTEFEALQSQTTITTVKYLKEPWIQKISQSVRMCLRDVGKGSFNLDEKMHDVYDVMKLKNFMQLIVLRMQHALRVLVENSIALYIGILVTPAECALHVDETFVWGENLVDSQFNPPGSPIFHLDIMMDDKQAFYSTDPDEYEGILVSLYDTSLTMCHQIRQVHPFLLHYLKFPPDLYLSSVGLLEVEVCEARDRLRMAYQKAAIPLSAYAREFAKYLDLFKLDVEKYVEEFKNDEHTAVELKEEVELHLAMKRNLDSTLPYSISIGPFHVNVKPLKEYLIQKREDCARTLLTMFTVKLRKMVDEILESYIQIRTRVREPAQSIEHIFELRDWMETIPVTVKNLDDTMRLLHLDFDVPDTFLWNLSDDDFQAKWEALGFPRKIDQQVAETTLKLMEDQEKFYSIQLQDEVLLQERIDTLVSNVANAVLQTDISKVHEAALDVKRIWKNMKDCQEQGLLLNERQRLFEVDVVPFDQLTRLIKEFEPYKSLWVTASDWFKWHEIWMENPLMTIDADQIDMTVTDLQKAINRSVKIFEENPNLLEIATTVRSLLRDFKPYITMIQALRDPGMKPRHFEELSVKTGIQMSLTPSLTFKSLVVFGIMEFEETVTAVTEAAAKEYTIEGALNKMIAEWDTITMDVLPYKETGTYVMKVAEENQILLDDHITVVQQLGFSPYKVAFEEQINEWEYKLNLTQEVIALWTEVQRQWMYLEPIFTSEDIGKQLPNETRKYNNMERNWRRIMSNALDKPFIIRICPDKSLLESLKECQGLLELVQKGLSEYLEAKRMIFPRFYFLSDEELLEIVAQSKVIQAVQPHLKKCFENIRELKFESDNQITMMFSAEGEEVTLRPPMYPQGYVEHWLGQVEQVMRNTLREIIGQALSVVETTPRKNWVYMWPGQVTLCCGQTYWTAHVEDAILNNNLPGYLRVMLGQLDDLRELIRGPQTIIQRLMLEAVITIEVHARDVLQNLIDENISNTNDFDWISQLRYYWTEDRQLKIRAVNAEFSYAYEYLGNNGRLVITPLTDRCYLTLTGALHLKFGGAPAGPAGTGKTETVKDLAKAFAVQCVVFNCSDQLDFMSMGKFFKGLASAGAWACFDEFNRIDIEVLSVIAQQIMTIQEALRMRVESFQFEGVEIALKPSCSVFITMNPGYAGRTELPDNLKALFRPVAMMVPDYALIAEISLFSYGFSDARNLAGKITTTFKLSSEQLSTQDHYDFGMRAVKTVIAVAGNLKREQLDLNEQQICLRALRDVNVPKFLKDDLKLFNGIVSDLFPRLEEKVPDYGILEAEIRKSILNRRLEDVDEFVKKVIQLYETIMVRHGLMLVGPTGSGKTKCYETLKEAFTKLKGKNLTSGRSFVPVITHVLNPKAVTMGQLYGEYDLDTREWTDGVLAKLLRAGIAVEDNNRWWFIFDGPVDAVWIENMNTVLDDNKKLCLTSGEIMKLLPTHTMIFEVADLRVASPATVSRCGMVYLDPEMLGLDPFVRCWLNSLPENMQQYLEAIVELTQQLLFPGLKLLRGSLREIVETVDCGIVQSYINLMNYRIGPMASRHGKPPPSANFQTLIPTLLSPWAAFSIVWSVGATCDYDSRCKFNNWIRSVQRKYRHALPFPEDGLVYDYRLHDGGFTDLIDGRDPIPPQWYKWLDDIPPVKITPEMKYADIEVPTMDSVRSAALIGFLLGNENNVLCVGPTGSGKTLTIAGKLSRNMPKKYICDFITFSARTTANQTQDLIDAKLDKRRKGIFGPPLLKKQVFFIDDLNMPALEVFGAQPPIELIRQFMDFSGWYDRKDIGTFRLIQDVNFVGAMGPPGGGRNPVTARLLRHFHFIAFPEMEDDAKTEIFRTILGSWMPETEEFKDMLGRLVSTTLQLFKIICTELLPTPDKSHYTFNLRDLSKVFQGLLMANPEKIAKRETLLLLWYHENQRVFSDRLVNNEDRQWFDRMLCRMLQSQFSYNIKKAIGDKVLFYGDFCQRVREYQQIVDMKKMEQVITDFLEDHNSTTTAPMRLVLFQDAIDHICRINRILRQPRGNALLLGMGGSGRRSLTILSAFMQDYTCFQIELSKGYTPADWRGDIKNIMLKAGLHDQYTVFLFSDTQIKTDSMLEDLNGILNSGDVPNVYEGEEMELIYHAMRGEVQEAGLSMNRSNLFAAYVKLVRNNLHTVITMSPVGEAFRARIRQFPALVNCCTIDWFAPWPDAALQSVAMQFLSDIQDESINDSILKSIVRTCQYMHSSVIDASDRYFKELNRHNYVTPASYLELLSSYGNLLGKTKFKMNTERNRLSTGLDKLASTEIEVKDMQKQLKDMKPKLERAAEATANMIQQITEDTIEAEIMKAEAVEQEATATKLKRENQLIRDEAEEDLSKARPMLIAAEQSLKALNKTDITEVKAMKRPPVGVVLVIEAMCIVNNVAPRKVPGKTPNDPITIDYWTPGSQMLADPGRFLQTMENYNKEDITAEMITRLKKYIEDPEFQPPRVIYVSKACHSLCLWVHAMYNYYFVNLKVRPKMEALAEAEKALKETEETLARAMQRLQEIQEGLERLQQQLQLEQEKKDELERQKQLCEDRMGRAVRLIVGLADEQKRWALIVKEIGVGLTNIIGDVLLSSGAIAYLTPFTDTYRDVLLSSWYEVLGEGVPHTSGSTPVSTLGDAMAIRTWQIEGLPRDTLSIENAVLMVHSERWPLFIDPQGQANKWIRTMCKASGLSVIKITDKDILRVLESCIRFGKPCLLENVGTELEAGLDPILLRSVFKHGGQTSIKIGDTIVPYNPDFHLYMTTRLTNPHYTPEVAVKVLLVNFALTASGLQDQMLSLVTIQERPDLEQARNALIVSNAEMRKELKDIENRILQRLSGSEGSVVDDMDLILTLEASKVKSEEIKAKMEAAEATGADIDATRSSYIPVAVRAQILYFCLSDLQYIDKMYQYSLEWFIEIFNRSTAATEKSNDIEKRIADINKSFTFSLFTNVCRSLFERHKLLFAFILCVRIRMNDNLIDPREWRHLLAGQTPSKELPNPSPDWITPLCWLEIQALEALPKFAEFVEAFQELVTQFKEIFDAQEAHLAIFPEPWRTNLDDFQKLLVLKCLRPDKVTNAMQIYLARYLGQEFVEPQTTELSAIFGESSSTTPIVFVLSPGTDPAADLHKFADKLKMSRKLQSISLGQGQGPRAEAMMKQACDMGNWVFFQNCHLAPSWMPNLESLAEGLSEKVHKEFRLWLTSAPSPEFPVSILQNSSKMTMEPPRGVKANMLRAYLTQVTEMHDFMLSEHPKVGLFKGLTFSLCMFHSVLLERRKFGPLGFNIPYEFTEGDLTICISQLHMFLLEYADVPYKVLIYTAGHINYGGRITDDWDRRCVLTILDDYYNPGVTSPDYKYDPEGIYHQLDETTAMNEYIDYIKSFPLNDEPSIFGMHPNADISSAQAETYSCLETLLALQPRQVGAAASSVEEITTQLAKDMLSTIPNTFDLSHLQSRYPVLYEESLNTVLVQEAKRYNALLETVEATLKDLGKALKGLVVMSEQLERMANSLYNNRIPKIWQDRGYPSLKTLGGWFEDLKRRMEFLRTWEAKGIPSAFWISGFYFPQAFLTGTLQNFARKYTISIDVINFTFNVLRSKPTEKPKDGCVVYGLFLEGCRWAGTHLDESFPKELYTDMPPILLLPEVDHIAPLHRSYSCPVYKTTIRAGTLSTTGHSTNFVLAIDIPSKKPQAHWIKRGVALICSLDY